MLEKTKGQFRETGKTGHTRRRKKTQNHCGGHHYTQTNTNNVNKKRALLQTTNGKYETIIFAMWKSWLTSQHWTQNVKTHNRTMQKKIHGSSVSSLIQSSLLTAMWCVIVNFFLCSFVNYKKGALDSQPQVIKLTSCLPMVGGSLRVLRLFHH
jgi:hypothetical protein